ncbi:MAG TPA: lantibiotic dehydratase [Thermoanaerobaculia bacterium]|jgi:hypothetical protein|nr:lantibiotic dehydratase [Thermoanaerobaculia bacterium]
MRSTPSPFIARIGGLPADVLEGFGSSLFSRQALDALEWERELGETRAELVDRLFSSIKHVSPELRRLLLNVKRDCFNGRSLARYEKLPQWKELSGPAGSLPERILELERRLAIWKSEFEAAYAQEAEREQAHLLALAENRRLRRGLALSNPLLVHTIEHLRRKKRGSLSGQDRKTEVSLLRFVSRAARKPSPYSTFTGLALGSMRGDLGGDAVRLLGADWHERSLLRLKRTLLDQYRDALLRFPLFRSGLRVVLNETIQEIAPDRYRLLRSGRWSLDEKTKWRFVQESLVKVSLTGPLIAWLLTHLDGRPTVLGQLIAELGEAFPKEETGRTLDRLLEIGFLDFLLPWPSNEGHLEPALLACLRSLPPDAKLQPFSDCLDRILSLEGGFVDAQDPASVVQEIDHLLGEAWLALEAFSGLPPEARPHTSPRGNFYEDVFLLPENGESPQDEIVEIPLATVDELAGTLEPVSRLSNLFNHRHDFLHAITAFMAQRWPERSEVSVLELFGEAQPLWNDYSRFLAAARRPDGWKSSFNPFELPQVQELDRLRQKVASDFVASIERDASGHHFTASGTASLLAEVPDRYLDSAGLCLLVQQADAHGDLWVLNRMYEGTGRYGSRFTPVMAEGMRRRYTDHFTGCSVLDSPEGPVELLDLMCAQGDTLNVHAVQTPRVLVLPGEAPGIPTSRRLSLADLRIRVAGEDRAPVVVDSAGRRYLPVHLGGASHAFMPMLVRFLSLFGPDELRSVFPPRPSAPISEVAVLPRLTIDRVVLMRKRWLFRPESLRQKVSLLSDPEAFVEVNRWRNTWQIPDRIFLLERIGHILFEERYKPQYFDFTSPLFLPILRAALETPDAVLGIEEVLPATEALPLDQKGKPWTVELLIDTLVTPREPNTVQSSAPTSSRVSGHPGAGREGFRQTEPGVAHF